MKKILMVLLLITMLIFAGCGGEEPEASQDTKETEITTEETAFVTTQGGKYTVGEEVSIVGQRWDVPYEKGETCLLTVQNADGTQDTFDCTFLPDSENYLIENGDYISVVKLKGTVLSEYVFETYSVITLYDCEILERE
jgi:hypothetical protein